MKKNITFLGKKVPVIAIVIAFLVIGTASAAVYEHYATMEGEVTILSPIAVTIDGVSIDLGEDYTFFIENMTSPCTISKSIKLNNSHELPLKVELLWVLYESGVEFPLDANTSYWIWDNITIELVPGIITHHTVSLDVPVYMIGDHTFAIAVNPVIE